MNNLLLALTLSLTLAIPAMADIPGVNLNNSYPNSDQAIELAQQNVYLVPNRASGVLEVLQGNILTTADELVTLHNHYCLVTVQPNCIAFIETQVDHCSVYNFVQTKSHACVVNVNNQKYVINPGSVLTITDNGQTSIETFTVSEAILNIQPLKKMLISSNPMDQIWLEQILKSFVILCN
jgi:hypothetical protein